MLTVWEVSLLLVVPFFGLFLVVEGALWSANIIKARAAREPPCSYLTTTRSTAAPLPTALRLPQALCAGPPLPPRLASLSIPPVLPYATGARGRLVHAGRGDG
jgi:hypothetical protein